MEQTKQSYEEFIRQIREPEPKYTNQSKAIAEILIEPFDSTFNRYFVLGIDTPKGTNVKVFSVRGFVPEYDSYEVMMLVNPTFVIDRVRDDSFLTQLGEITIPALPTQEHAPFVPTKATLTKIKRMHRWYNTKTKWVNTASVNLLIKLLGQQEKEITGARFRLHNKNVELALCPNKAVETILKNSIYECQVQKELATKLCNKTYRKLDQIKLAVNKRY